MADINVERFYHGILIDGRRNAPTYKEVRREAASMTKRTLDAETMVRF